MIEIQQDGSVPEQVTEGETFDTCISISASPTVEFLIVNIISNTPGKYFH